jgi:hypothetical protein
MNTYDNTRLYSLILRYDDKGKLIAGGRQMVLKSNKIAIYGQSKIGYVDILFPILSFF